MVAAHANPCRANGGSGGGGDGFTALACDYMRQVVCGTSHGRSKVMEKIRARAYDKGPKAQAAAQAVAADFVDWIRRSGPWKAALVISVGVIGAAAFGALALFLVLFVTATANAILISFVLAVSMVGFLMTSFFTSLTAVYVGILLAAAVTISTVTFLSICGMIISAGWFTLTWAAWNSCKKASQLARGLFVIVASTVASMAAPGGGGGD